MRRGPLRLAPLLLGLSLGLLAGDALAQRIVLVRPRSSDEALLSAFAHLQGELRVHDFEVVLVDATGGAVPDDLEQAAEREGAVAAIALLRSRDLATADIWVSDRVTGKTSRRTITTPPRSEGPNVLAVRAVDLLRASLREFGASPKPPPDVVGAAPSRAPERVLDWAATEPARVPRFTLGAGLALQGTPQGFDPAYGPAISLGSEPFSSLALRLSFQGPFWGARYQTENASATLLQEQLMAEVGWHFAPQAPLSWSVLGALGVHHLSAQGEATPPYEPERDNAWAGLFGLGLIGEWRFSTAASLSLGVRSFVLAPKPVVTVGADHVDFGRPLLQITSGIDVAL